jgi:hypothetical protein
MINECQAGAIVASLNGLSGIRHAAAREENN